MREERRQSPVLALSLNLWICRDLRAIDSRVGEGTRTPDIQIHSLTL
jgi:hypothetical protein